MRLQRLGIQRIWQQDLKSRILGKYGTTIMLVIFVVFVTIALVVLFKEMKGNWEVAAKPPKPLSIWRHLLRLWQTELELSQVGAVNSSQEWINGIDFVGVGSFLFGAFFYVMWRGNFKKIYISFFKTKEIQKCKERLRTLDFSRIESKKRVDVYVSKLQDFSPEIIAEAEKLYFKQKLFDDLTEYLLQMTYDINEVFITKRFLKDLNIQKNLIRSTNLLRH